MNLPRCLLLFALLTLLPRGTSACGQTAAGARDAGGLEVAAMESTVIADGLEGPLRLAISPTGQVLYVLRGRLGDVLAIDLAEPGKRWTAVPAMAGGRPVAIGVVDSSTLALVVRQDGAWSIRTHRLAPPGMAPDNAPAQVVALGASAADGDAVGLVVHPSRDWLAVVGLPDPLPPILRTTITGARLGAASQRRCPQTGGRPAVLTVGNSGEWGVFLKDASDRSSLVWYSSSGAQRLQTLDLAGLSVIDAASCRESGLLWVAADPAGSGDASGLWRIDAAYVDGRQVARVVAIAPAPAPTAVVCLPKGEVALAHGIDGARVVRLVPRGVGPQAGRVDGSQGKQP